MLRRRTAPHDLDARVYVLFEYKDSHPWTRGTAADRDGVRGIWEYLLQRKGESSS